MKKIPFEINGIEVDVWLEKDNESITLKVEHRNSNDDGCNVCALLSDGMLYLCDCMDMGLGLQTEGADNHIFINLESEV